MQNLKSFVSKHPFFKGLKKSYLDLILGCASEARFDSGETIFREGERADKFYIILQGKVAIEALMAPERDPITILNLGENDVLGWSWLFAPHRWHFDARATAPTKAISIDGDKIRKKCEEDHDLGYELMKRFATIIEQRLRSVRSQNPNMYAVHA
ncbi:MAG: cyclic nucleotide-binding domain-containing protein [Deltaproteobacteria bacterium]|nr:cyclic nucleotide-binding domain-containing protein [Deltaproteobacteria bacterium]